MNKARCRIYADEIPIALKLSSNYRGDRRPTGLAINTLYSRFISQIFKLEIHKLHAVFQVMWVCA